MEGIGHRYLSRGQYAGQPPILGGFKCSIGTNLRV